MKILKKFLISSLASLAILIAGNSQAMERDGKYLYANFSKQISMEELSRKHMVADEIKEILDASLNYDLKDRNNMIKDGVYQLSTLPGYLIKAKTSRIIGSLAINQCADKYKL